LEDEGLTDNLTDDDARRLLEWGMAWVERWVQEMSPAAEGNSTEGHPPLSRDDALSKPELGDKLRSLRQVMRHVNGLVGRHRVLSPAELTAELGHLWELVASLTGEVSGLRNKKLETNLEVEGERLAAEASDMDDGEFLAKVLDLLWMGEGKE